MCVGASNVFLRGVVRCFRIEIGFNCVPTTIKYTFKSKILWTNGRCVIIVNDDDDVCVHFRISLPSIPPKLMLSSERQCERASEWLNELVCAPHISNARWRVVNQLSLCCTSFYVFLCTLLGSFALFVFRSIWFIGQMLEYYVLMPQ